MYIYTTPRDLTLTYSILSLVVLLGELVTVAEEKLPPPDVDDSSNGEVTVMVVLSLNSSSLKESASCG